MTLFNNTKWVALSQVSKIVAQLISMIVLARLIDPAQFGIMAIAMVVVTFSSLFRDLGTSSAIIQQKILTESLKNAIFGLNLAMGCFVCFCVAICSPLVAYFYEQSILIPVLLLLAISFPIMSLGSIQLALLERESNFKSVAFIEVCASLISVILAVFTAYLGWGVYSLVILNLSSSIISTALLWIKTNWYPNLKQIFNLKQIKKIFGYSSHLTLFNFINYFSRNADSIIVGKVLGTAILGAYSLAYRIMLFPLQSLTFVISRSLFPIMSLHQEDNDRLLKTYLKVLSLIFFLVFPIMIGLATLREPFVYLVFGKEWQLTADILLWLAPTAIIQALVSTTGTVFMAKGKTNVLSYLGMLGMVLQVGAFVIGVQYGIVTMAKFYFIANVLNAILPLYITIKLLNGRFNQLLFTLMPTFIIGLLMFVVLEYLLSLNYFKNDLVTWKSFMILVISPAIVYLLISFIFKNQLGFIRKEK